MIELVLLLTVAAALFRQNESKLAALMFVAGCLFYNAISDYISNNDIYYILAAFTDLIIIRAISKIPKLNQTLINLQNICILFMYVNLLGLIVYWLELPPIMYSLPSLVLFILALLATIHRSGDCERDRSNYKFSGLYLPINPSPQVSRGIKKEI